MNANPPEPIPVFNQFIKSPPASPVPSGSGSGHQQTIDTCDDNWGISSDSHNSDDKQGNEDFCNEASLEMKQEEDTTDKSFRMELSKIIIDGKFSHGMSGRLLKLLRANGHPDLPDSKEKLLGISSSNVKTKECCQGGQVYELLLDIRSTVQNISTRLTKLESDVETTNCRLNDINSNLKKIDLAICPPDEGQFPIETTDDWERANEDFKNPAKKSGMQALLRKKMEEDPKKWLTKLIPRELLKTHFSLNDTKICLYSSDIIQFCISICGKSVFSKMFQDLKGQQRSQINYHSDKAKAKRTGKTDGDGNPPTKKAKTETSDPPPPSPPPQ